MSEQDMIKAESQEIIKAGPIEGRVAGVLTARELAMNIGSEHGVQIGMTFKVMEENATPVIDPMSNETLGFLEREKVSVKVTEVRERFSIARTYKTRTIKGSPFMDSMFGGIAVAGMALTPSRTVTETLKAADSDWLPPLSEEQSFVRRGDRVVQVVEDVG